MRVRMPVSVAGAVVAGVLVFTAPAFAVAPEGPVTREPKLVTGTTAVLYGELNPGAADLESEEYQFAYEQSGSECAGGLVAPEPADIGVGGRGEGVHVEVTGLEAGREYTFCVVAIHEGEPSYGAPWTFTTPPVAPVIAPASETASGSTPFEATL